MNRVVHFEIPADNTDRARTFYEKVFGWKANFIPGFDYISLLTSEVDEQTKMPKNPGSINGGMMKRVPDVRNPVIIIEVSDLDSVLKRLESMGGKILRGKSKVGDMGYAAYFRDSEGNVMGLWENIRKS